MKTIAFYSARVFGEERAEVLKKSGLFPVTYIEHWRRPSPHKGELTRYGPVRIKGQTVYRVGGSIRFNEATRNRDRSRRVSWNVFETYMYVYTVVT